MILDLAVQNLLSPAVLFFVIGVGAALARSDLAVPEPVARLLSLYLMMSIGFRGGLEIAHHGITWQLAAALAALTRLPRADRAAIAGHYGSISAVTFAAATGALVQVGMSVEGFMVAVAAAMETPAILAALLLAGTGGGDRRGTLREVLLNGSVLTLLGALVIGAVASAKGAAPVKPFLVELFPGFLCLFLLEMGLVAGRGLRDGRGYLRGGLMVFALGSPVMGASLALGLAWLVGLSAGGAAILMTLAASASYIAVPAALRLALPEARLAIPLTMSLVITFPFNLLVGIPVYIGVARAVLG